MKYFWLISSYLVVSCNNQTPNEVESNKPTTIDLLSTKLIGEWGGLNSDIPVWEITSDSIYYFNENKTYHYRITEGAMVIDRTDEKLTFSNISIIADTLIFYPHGPDSETRIFRIRREN
jgi:hypothetical protein